jgi:hypothetical protein
VIHDLFAIFSAARNAKSPASGDFGEFGDAYGSKESILAVNS